MSEDEFQVDAFSKEGDLRVTLYERLGINSQIVRKALDDLQKALNAYDMFTRPQEKNNILSTFAEWNQLPHVNMDMLALAIYIKNTYPNQHPSTFINNQDIISVLMQKIDKKAYNAQTLLKYQADLIRYWIAVEKIYN